MTARVKNIVGAALEGLLVVLMTASVLNVLWQVFTRFVLRQPSSFSEELARYLLIWLGVMGAAYAAGKKMHPAIDLLVQRLKGRRKRTLEMAIQAFVAFFAFAVMVIGGIRLVSMTFALNQVSAALRIKLGFVYLAIPLSGLLILFFALGSIWETAKGLIEPKTNGRGEAER